MPILVEFQGGPLSGQQLSWDPPLPEVVWWFLALHALGWAPTPVQDEIPAGVRDTARYDLGVSDEWTAQYTHTPGA